jgi:hypothetical protein
MNNGTLGCLSDCKPKDTSGGSRKGASSLSASPGPTSWMRAMSRNSPSRNVSPFAIPGITSEVCESHVELNPPHIVTLGSLIREFRRFRDDYEWYEQQIEKADWNADDFTDSPSAYVLDSFRTINW